MLHVETEGKGRNLLLLHGWGLNLRVWDAIVPELARDFRIVRVDLPGHGRSPWMSQARALEEQARLIAESVQASRNDSSSDDAFTVLGWSLGGQLALALAASGHIQVDRLVLVATTPKFAASSDWPHGMAPAVLERFAAHLAQDYRRTVREFLELQVRGSADGDKVLQELNSALFTHGEAQPEALAAGLDILAGTDLRPRLPLVSSPSLVIAGQYDRVTSPAASRALATALPDAEYVELRRAGHAPFLSHAEHFAEHVRSFLSQHADA